MVDPGRIYLWAWDARPYPAFPLHGGRWADAANFETGHWLNGRIEGAPMDDLLGAMLADHGLAAQRPIAADGFVEGYVIDRPMSLRAAIEPLAATFGFDVVATGGAARFVRRSSRAVAVLSDDDCVMEPADGRPTRIRAQDSELPAALTLGFVDADMDYRQAAARAAMPHVPAGREAVAELAAGLRRALALQRAEVMLNEARIARDSISLALPPSRIGLEPGDAIEVDGRAYRLRRVVDGAVRTVEAVATEPAAHLGAPQIALPPSRPPPPLAGPPLAIVLDLAAADSSASPLQRLAVTAVPWPGAYTIWRSASGEDFEAVQRVATAATIGLTTSPLRPGPLWRLDRAATVEMMISQGALQSVPLLAALDGANLLAIAAPGGGWEILSFLQAELLGPGRWRVSGLIRGLAGSEPFAAIQKPVGSRVVVLDGAVVGLASGMDDLNRSYSYRIAQEGRDHAEPMARTIQTAAGPYTLLPLSPVGLKARREAGGVRFSWIRRTRFGGYNWELSDVPLNEDREAYAIEIMAGGASLRSFASSAPELLYPSSTELVDFGAPQASHSIRVAQLSATAGPGRFAAADLRVG